MDKIIVCILNKNDGENLKLLQTDIINFSKKYKTVFVDANSEDESRLIAKSMGLEVMDLNLSRGEAISHCVNNFKNKYNYIIFLSSDGEEDVKDIFKFEKYFDDGADMVIASRLMPGGYFKSDKNILWIHRKLFLIFITFIINLLFRGNIFDCWNGFRGFKLKCFEEIKIEEKNHLVEAETTIKFLKKKFKIVEFPTKENPRIYGKSVNPPIKSGIGHIILVIKEFFKFSRN